MPTHDSYKKSMLKDEERRIIRKGKKSRMKTMMKKYENKEIEFSTIQSEIAKAAKHGIIHKKTASRKISRLAKIA